MAINCGLKALGQMTTLEHFSMFSLIHLARDNGLNLYFCKVEPEELVLVARPAIFHQKDHFVFVEDEQPMPEGEYTGYVLTPKPLHEPLPYSLAKRIKGSKKVGGFLRPIITGVASMINPMLGAVVGAGMGGWAASTGETKGDWWRIPLGAATGYLQGAPGKTFGMGNAALAGGLAAAGEVPGAIKTGNWMAPVSAGLGQYIGAKGIQGASQGLAKAGPGFMNKVTGAAKGGMQGLGFTGGGAGGMAGGAPPAAGAMGATPAGYTGTITVPGIGSNISASAIPGITGAAGRLASAGGMQVSGMPGTDGGGGILGKLKGFLPGQGASGLSWMGTAASALLPQPELDANIMGDYTKAAQYLGGDSFKALPTATRQQLEKYTDMSLDDLSQEFIAQDDKGLRMLEEKKKSAIDNLMTQYANYGQDPYTSSDAQRKLTEVTRQYDQAMAEYQQQIQNQAMQQAIQFKQQILQKSMEQGQFDYESAMELATYVGREQELQYALESKDQEKLQEVLAELFSLGTSR